jgi:hypothetical protein
MFCAGWKRRLISAEAIADVNAEQHASVVTRSPDVLRENFESEF